MDLVTRQYQKYISDLMLRWLHMSQRWKIHDLWHQPIIESFRNECAEGFVKMVITFSTPQEDFRVGFMIVTVWFTRVPHISETSYCHKLKWVYLVTTVCYCLIFYCYVPWMLKLGSFWISPVVASSEDTLCVQPARCSLAEMPKEHDGAVSTESCTFFVKAVSVTDSRLTTIIKQSRMETVRCRLEDYISLDSRKSAINWLHWVHKS